MMNCTIEKSVNAGLGCPRMKKLLLLVAAIACCTTVLYAQDREHTSAAQLSYKSKEIKKALFWKKNTSTGKWESRKNTTLVYLGQGVVINNFNSIFIGEYSGCRYLFLDYKNCEWRYPNLKLEWILKRTIMAALISDDEYDRMKSIETGEILTITPSFYNKMFKGHIEYSFPFFLELVETLRSSSETLYKSYEKAYGQSYADRQQKSKYSAIFWVLKRTIGEKGRDVVRFTLYPQAVAEFIDSFYFEVDYSVYQNLFIADKKKNYK